MDCSDCPLSHSDRLRNLCLKLLECVLLWMHCRSTVLCVYHLCVCSLLHVQHPVGVLCSVWSTLQRDCVLCVAPCENTVGVLFSMSSTHVGALCFVCSTLKGYCALCTAPCESTVFCVQHPCGTTVLCVQQPCGSTVFCVQHPCGSTVLCMQHPCGNTVLCVQHSVGVRCSVCSTHENTVLHVQHPSRSTVLCMQHHCRCRCIILHV